MQRVQSKTQEAECREQAAAVAGKRAVQQQQAKDPEGAVCRAVEMQSAGGEKRMAEAERRQ